MVALTVSIPTSANAQAARAESSTSANLAFFQSCPVVKADATENDGRRHRPEAAGAILGAAVGLVGDLVSSGVKALGGALEAASQEKAFNADGVTSFPFYKISLTNAEPSVASIFANMSDGASVCLILSVAPTGVKGVPKADMTELGGHLPEVYRSPQADVYSRWISLGINDSSNLYIEAELQKRPDGFRVRPVLIWYRKPFGGAPNRALHTELHVTFATPSAPAQDSALGSPFALARIKLPAIAPGTALGPNELIGYSSVVVPPRPTTGSPETTMNEINAVMSGIPAKQAEIDGFTAAATKNPNGPEAKKLKEAKAALAALSAQKDKIELKVDADGWYNEHVGTTNVQMRFVVVRNANQFGMAIAAALKGKADAIGTAVTEELKPTPAKSAWTSEQTGYVTAMVDVDVAKRAYDAALASGDAAAAAVALDELKRTRATANEKAAAAGKPLPFPNI